MTILCSNNKSTMEVCKDAVPCILCAGAISGANRGVSNFNKSKTKVDTMVHTTISIEDKYMVSFGEKTPVSFERGEGIKVWDESGKEYLDFTSGWAVTSLGHSHPVVINALNEQCKKIMHNPNSGLTYSPARARLLSLLVKILPSHLHKIFFTNSGAEANDAAIKIARKVTGKKKVIAASMGFHGRTIGTTSATGQSSHRDRFNVLVPHFTFVEFNNIEAMQRERRLVDS